MKVQKQMKKVIEIACVALGLAAVAAPSVEITKVKLADARDGTVEYAYTVSGDFEGGSYYDLLVKISSDDGMKSVVLTNKSVAAGSKTETVNVKTLLAKAYPGVAVFAKLEKRLGGVQLWEGGPYWAECNVGAAKPDEYGYRFWWGDTVGYTQNVNKAGWDAVDGSVTGFEFSDSNAKIATYGKSSEQLYDGGTGCIDANSKDGKLKPEYDAATAYLGSPWRMPTKAEIDAFVDNCTTEWTANWEGTGKAGYIVRGKGAYASKSIFLPDALDEYPNGGWGCHYWVSTILLDDSNEAWNLDIKYMDTEDYDPRFFANYVRPVRSFAE